MTTKISIFISFFFVTLTDFGCRFCCRFIFYFYFQTVLINPLNWFPPRAIIEAKTSVLLLLL